MKKLVQEGTYSLIETKRKTRILTLDHTISFAWITVKGIGEMLVTTLSKFQPYTILASGKYKLFDVKNEPNYVDLQHLELEAGNDVWQGYLLPTGLPTKEDKRRRIISTNELIGPNSEKISSYDNFIEKFNIVPPPLM